jgi:hypothetical protein
MVYASLCESKLNGRVVPRLQPGGFLFFTPVGEGSKDTRVDAYPIISLIVNPRLFVGVDDTRVGYF